jgi:hypothetical protein
MGTLSFVTLVCSSAKRDSTLPEPVSTTILCSTATASACTTSCSSISTLRVQKGGSLAVSGPTPAGMGSRFWSHGARFR